MTIKEAREGAGLTQKQLSEKIGVAQSNLARWETGRRNPKLESLQRIAAACGVPADWLLSNKSEIAAIKAGLFNRPQTCKSVFSQIPQSLLDSCTANQIAEIAHAIDAAYQSGRKSTRAEVDEDGNDIVWLQIGNDFPLYGIEWYEKDGKFTAKCLTK